MLPQVKTLKISFERALKAIGDDSLIQTLYSLQDQRIIKSFDIEVLIHVDREKSAAIETFFLSEEPRSTAAKKRRID